MRIIDGDELVMWLSKWMVSSFGVEPTEETKAIKAVCDAVGDMVKDLERKKKDGGIIRRQDAIDAMVAEVDQVIDNLHIKAVTEARLRDAVNRLPSAEPESERYEYHYDHTDCIWYRPEARNRCPATCAQYRDGWNDAMNYIFRDGEGYRPFRRDKKYEG